MSSPSIADLRRTYGRAALSESDVAADPMRQFDRWLREALAAQVEEANAMTLATVGGNARPSSRVVLIKDYDLEPRADGAAAGLVWYTNYRSRKGANLVLHPHAALLFHWIPLERQVRIEGRVEPVSAQQSDAYFASRPYDSRIAAWASAQSEVLVSRAALEQQAAELARRYPEEVPRPPQWGGYRLVPDYFEFWQGRASRLHDRIAYRQQAPGRWQIVRLAP